MCAYPQYREVAGGLTPCGQCHPCRFNRRRQKTTRIVLESKTHEHCLYVTLTYDQDHLPTEDINPITGEVLYSHPSGTVSKRHIQNFMKRLRRRFPSGSIRYWAVGEYGDKKWRPHYHLILWGIPYDKRIAIHECWTDPDTELPLCDPARLDIQLPRSDWDVGSYVSAYVVKKMTNPKDERLEGRRPEFFLSSKGVGLAFVEKYVAAMSSHSAKLYLDEKGDIPRVILLDGKKMPIDRYMRGKIIDALRIKEKATETAQKNFKEEMHLVRSRAIKNSQIPKNWHHDKKRLGWALEKQAGIERAGQLALEERKQVLKNSRKEKLDA